MICAYTADVLLNGILLVLASPLQPAINAYMTCELVEYRVFVYIAIHLLQVFYTSFLSGRLKTATIHAL